MLLAAALGVLLAAGASSPAFAHDELLGSDPAAGAVVDAAPSEIELTFSGVLLDEPGATEISVLDAQCRPMGEGDPVLDGTRVRQSLSTTDAAGAVTVVWRVVSSDGHPVAGEYSFAIGEAGPEPSCAAEPASDGGEADLVPLVVGGVVVLVAAVGVGALAARRRRPRED